jgi:hypothetical protein
MARFDLLARPQPFIGLLLAAAGWGLSHQVGSNSVFDDCAVRSGGFVVLVCIIGLILTAAGGVYCFYSWRVPERSGRSFLGLLGALLSLVAGFAIVLQLAAGLILPACTG